MNIEYNPAPNTDPCGTPHSNAHEEESASLIQTLSFLLSRYDSNQHQVVSSIPYMWRMWSTVSNAADKSSDPSTVHFPVSITSF